MSIKFIHTKLDLLDYADFFNYCEGFIESNICNVVSFINLHAMNYAAKNAAFRDSVNSSNIVLNDGVGVEMLCRLNKTPVLRNMNGTDLIPELLKWASEKDLGIYLLGSKYEVVKAAAEQLNAKKINIAGYHDGYFDKDNCDSIIDHINESQAEILVLGMGMPVQEIWIENHRSRLLKVRIAICGGAIVDYISGTLKRSPDWIIKFRLEWLYRLLREPGRLFKRNISGVFRLIYSSVYIMFKRNK